MARASSYTLMQGKTVLAIGSLPTVRGFILRTCPPKLEWHVRRAKTFSQLRKVVYDWAALEATKPTAELGYDETTDTVIQYQEAR